MEFAIAQCRELIDQGVRGIHLYCLNERHARQRNLDTLELIGTGHECESRGRGLRVSFLTSDETRG